MNRPVEQNTFHDTANPMAATGKQDPLPQMRKRDVGDIRDVADHNLIVTALREALAADPSITDFIVNENRPMRVACARGKIPLSDVLENNDKLTGKINRAAIVYFVAIELMEAKSLEEAAANSKLINEEYMAKQSSLGNSIRLSWEYKTRVILFRQNRNMYGMVGRITSLLTASLSEIGLPHQAVNAIKSNQRGLILITGDIGAGKTSTAQAILEHYNQTIRGHIMTVQDPIETSLDDNKCSITNKEVGIDVYDFAEGLRDALRQSVDILLIGELRDKESVMTAINASASGLLVIATTHGSSCAGALVRVMSMLGQEEQSYWKVLGNSLLVTLCQAKVPKAAQNGWVIVSDALIGTKSVLTTVSEGNIGALEALTKTPTSSPKEGWISMNDSLNHLVGKKVVTAASARTLSTAPEGIVLPPRQLQ